MALELTHRFTDYVSYSDIALDVNYIRLKTVLQTHFVNEKNINNDCKGTCHDIQKHHLRNDKHCVGDIYYCNNVIRKTKTASKIYSVSLTKNLHLISGLQFHHLS